MKLTLHSLLNHKKKNFHGKKNQNINSHKSQKIKIIQCKK